MRLRVIIATLLMLVASPTAHAQLQDLDPLSATELDSLRGGFMLQNGMTIDFSIIRDNAINGQLINSTAFSSEGMALSAVSTDNFRSSVTLGNGIQAAALSQLPGLVTVIQNSTDHATIANLNTMNVDVKNLQAFRDQRQWTTIRESQTLFNR